VNSEYTRDYFGLRVHYFLHLVCDLSIQSWIATVVEGLKCCKGVILAYCDGHNCGDDRDCGDDHGCGDLQEGNGEIHDGLDVSCLPSVAVN
jgi:hypothetical protein